MSTHLVSLTRLFETVDKMPEPARRTRPKTDRKTHIASNVPYQGGYVVCHCGSISPESTDPMEPYRWLVGHECR